MELYYCYHRNSHLSPLKNSTNLKANPSPASRRSKYSAQSISKIEPGNVYTPRGNRIQLIVEEYREKLKHYCGVEDVLIKSNPKTTSDVKAQIEAEDATMMQHIKPEDWVVVLDENGREINSEQMADLLGDAGKTGSSRLTFCVGGPYGHGPLVRERADAAIRLSSLVLNHQVALVVLVEQLYRAKIPPLVHLSVAIQKLLNQRKEPAAAFQDSIQIRRPSHANSANGFREWSRKAGKS